jgi:transposase
MDNRGCQLLYLPAYSLDFNPIELTFLKIKAYVKQNRAVAQEERNVNNTNVVLYLL